MSADAIQPVRIAMLPLTDAAPLVVAQDQGFFAEQGVDVCLELRHSWASIRDALQLEDVDGAQLLPLMPMACSLGLDGLPTPIDTLLTLNLNGNAISLATNIHEAMPGIAPFAESNDSPQRLAPVKTKGAIAPPLDLPITPSARALEALVRQRQKQGLPPLRLAHVHPFSSHHYLLRGWLASAGLDPDNDVALRVVPPSLMVEQLSLGNIDGFCAGAPWSDAAQAAGLAQPICRCEELWPAAVEKVFGMRADWVKAHPQECEAVLKALLKAGEWLDASAEHRLAASHLLSDGGYLALPTEIIEKELYARYTQRRPGELPGMSFSGSIQRPEQQALAWYAQHVVRWASAFDKKALLDAINRTTQPGWYDHIQRQRKLAATD